MRLDCLAGDVGEHLLAEAARGQHRKYSAHHSQDITPHTQNKTAQQRALAAELALRTVSADVILDSPEATVKFEKARAVKASTARAPTQWCFQRVSVGSQMASRQTVST